MSETQNFQNMNSADITTSKKFEITGAALKWIAIITMLIDHIGAAILEPSIPWDSPDVFDNSIFVWDSLIRGVGRIAFPIFIFLIVEGFFYTRSRKKYFIRMLMFSLVSEIPFDLAFQSGAFPKGGLTLDSPAFFNMESQNVFFTLTLGFLAMWLTETVEGFLNNKIATDANSKSNIFLYRFLLILSIFVIVMGCALAAEYLETDYSSYGVLAIFACYLAKKKSGNYPLMMLAPVVVLILMSTSEIPALIDVGLVLLYHGTKGKNINKWFFYAFYPVHLLVLWTIRLIFF